MRVLALAAAICILVSHIASRCVADEVVFYDGSIIPEVAIPSWERIGTFDCARATAPGGFCQHPELGRWAPPPYGEFDGYKRSLSDYLEAPGLFAECEVETDAPVADLAGGPVVFVLGGSSGFYHIVITSEQARFDRSNLVPIYYVTYPSGISHRFRIELRRDASYAWYLDNRLVDGGVPLAEFPVDDSVVQWSAQYYLHDHTTCWHYIRYGELKPELPGDVNCDGRFDNFDIDPFVMALAEPEAYSATYPDCPLSNRDIDLDGALSNFDIDPFVNMLVNLP